MKKLQDFPNEFVRIDININLLQTQIMKALNYDKPSSMDDRWYVNCENNFINFYRTWTGRCIYRAKINDKKNSLIELYINNNLEEYKFSNIDEELILFNKIFELLLSDRSDVL